MVSGESSFVKSFYHKNWGQVDGQSAAAHIRNSPGFGKTKSIPSRSGGSHHRGKFRTVGGAIC
jgi:hypothetical protein